MMPLEIDLTAFIVYFQGIRTNGVDKSAVVAACGCQRPLLEQEVLEEGPFLQVRCARLKRSTGNVSCRVRSGIGF